MAENQLGVRTRSMTDTQHTEGGNQNYTEHQPVQMNPERAPDHHHNPHNPNHQGTVQNPKVELTRIDDMEEYVRRHSDISLD